jgi:hypothetical protein
MAQIRRLRRIPSVAEIVRVIDEANGVGGFRRLTGLSKQSVTNAKRDNRLSAKTFIIVTEELHRLNCRAPAALWGIIDPRTARRAA